MHFYECIIHKEGLRFYPQISKRHELLHILFLHMFKRATQLKLFIIVFKNNKTNEIHQRAFFEESFKLYIILIAETVSMKLAL